MTLCPCRYSPSGALPRRKLHTWSSSCTQSPGNSTHVVVAATTAVGVGSTLFAVTSTAMMRSIRRGRLVERTCRGGHLGHHGTDPFENSDPGNDVQRRVRTVRTGRRNSENLVPVRGNRYTVGGKPVRAEVIGLQRSASASREHEDLVA